MRDAPPPSGGLPQGRQPRREAWAIGEILPGLLRRKKFAEKGRYGALVEAWAGIVGEAVAARTSIRSFLDGELVVEVDSPVLLHEMNSFLKQPFLQALQATPGGRDVARLRFCLGAQDKQGR